MKPLSYEKKKKKRYGRKERRSVDFMLWASYNVSIEDLIHLLLFGEDGRAPRSAHKAAASVRGTGTSFKTSSSATHCMVATKHRQSVNASTRNVQESTHKKHYKLLESRTQLDKVMRPVTR